MKDLPPVEFEIHGEPFEDTGHEDVQIHRDDLDAEFQNQAERRLKWGDVEAWSREQLTTLKNELTVIDSLIGARERDNMAKAGVKVTEGRVAECINTHKDHKEQLARIAKAQRQLDQAVTRRESMNHRRDMLVGMGANYRAEGNADPIILREEARRKSFEREKTKAEERAAKKESAQKAAEAAAKKKPPGKRPPGKKPPGKKPPQMSA